MNRIPIALMLLLRFLWQVASAGITTAWLIVNPTNRPQGDLVRMSYENLSDFGVTVLGCMVTLTPGTTTIDVDPERGELLLHMLDASDPAPAIAEIRRQFEAPLQKLFPAGGPR